MSTRIMLTNVRLSFPDLFVARAFNASTEPKFKATFLIDKNDSQIKVIEAAIREAAVAKFGAAKADAIIKQIRNNPNKFCFQDGDTKDYDGYAGMMAISASNKTRPTVIDRDKTPLDSSDGKPYAGCYVNASVEFFGYDNSGNGISASLRGVQFVSDGDAFSGGGAAAVDEFADVAEGATADDLV